MNRRPKGASLVKKRTIVIANHNTSVSMESAFWDSLKEIAASEGIPINRLVSRIHAKRQNANMSSAVRVYILEYYRRLIEQALTAGGARGKRKR
jgi:predicted DNA-binding ribbon-helix-helix protein